MTFFDFLYFSIFKWYRTFNDNSPEFAASCAISGLQTFNIVSLTLAYDAVNGNEKITLSKGFALALILGLIAINYIRYIRLEKFHYEKIELEWEMKSLKFRKANRAYQIIYGTVSTLFFFALVFYFASKRM